jgi:hypothetical protein
MCRNLNQVMELVRETPGTFRYDAIGTKSPAPTIYIKKAHFGKSSPPAMIRLSIVERK